MKILIVEDEPSLREIMVQTLRREQYVVEQAADYASALDKIAGYDYEKVLRKGDNLILSAFGGGYTWGAIYVKWAYDGSKACQIDSSEK